MILKCQKESYLKEFDSVVKSCKTAQITINNKESKGYEVILEDTILFAEGGGQPSDTGTMNGKKVLSVRKCGVDAIHFVDSDQPLIDGERVHLAVDWQRRWDHMQHHSAQHLISAIAETMFSLRTTSWTLSENISYIELDATHVSDDILNQLETFVNEKIVAAVPVNVMLYTKHDIALADVRTRLELPELQLDVIRVVNIEGIDQNTCCGTHVSNLSHLQAIKILYVEKGKKNKCNLFFLVGNRLLTYMNNTIKREKMLNLSLKCSSDEFVPMVEKLQKSLKLSQKNCLNAVRDLAKLEAQKFLNLKSKPRFYLIHRKESDFDFINIFINEVKADASDTLLVLSVTDDSINPKSSGQLCLAGNFKLVEQFSAKVLEILGGKGSLKDGKFQAKVENISKRTKLDDLIRNELN